MSDELKDILSNLNNEIEQDKLLDYINKNLSAPDAHEVEKQMADDPFMNDAVEGLQRFSNKKDLPLFVEQLNRDMKKQLEKKRERKEKRKFKDHPWIYFAIVLMLILLAICYYIVRKKMQHQQNKTPDTKSSVTYRDKSNQTSFSI